MVTLTKLPAADLEVFQLAQADHRFLAEHGREAGWQPCEREHYEALMDVIHNQRRRRAA